eukprot:TRINITY_DN12863_c0_g1_i1.p1 TRINITY_DN12863_c0_g1~~TRINITY_DN12863_c0_g1_i1.p1  ORF type:complete len:178 (-),score=18.17 TRINITY_DN12863_c0_g1_i1:124-657(-)
MKIRRSADYSFSRENARQRKNEEIYAANLKLLRRILSIDSSPSHITVSLAHSHKRRKSLNKPFRNKIEKQITKENKYLLSRLQNARSVYSNRQWKDAHTKHQLLTHNISQVEGKERVRKFSEMKFILERPRTALSIRMKKQSFKERKESMLVVDNESCNPSEYTKSIRPHTVKHCEL